MMDNKRKIEMAVSKSLARHKALPPQHRLSRLYLLLPHVVDRMLLDYNTNEMSSFSEIRSEATPVFVLKAKPKPQQLPRTPSRSDGGEMPAL